MKRTMRKKLELNRESLRHLDAGTLDLVRGGTLFPTLAECATSERVVCRTSCLECFRYPSEEPVNCGTL